MDVLICVATPLEGALLREKIGGERGSIGGRSVELLETGVGPVNAAHALARRIDPAASVVVCGVGGAYPGSGLEIGDVACAVTDEYGDLGAEDGPDGFMDMAALGFPVVKTYHNRLPLSLFPCETRRAFVTCSTCTGTDARAQWLADRTGGAVESMEGAALVHVALLHDTPVGQVRGISNPVGNRDRAQWRVKEATRAAQDAVLAWIEQGAC